MPKEEFVDDDFIEEDFDEEIPPVPRMNQVTNPKNRMNKKNVRNSQQEVIDRFQLFNQQAMAGIIDTQTEKLMSGDEAIVEVLNRLERIENSVA